MKDVELHYRLTGRGWVECRLQIGVEAATFIASYISDPASELISACIGLLEGSVDQRVSFLDEPGEHRLILSASCPSQLHVRICSYSDSHPHLPDSDGVVIFDSQCDLMRFVRAVSRAFQDVLDQHGCDGYKQLWANADFPLSQFQSLKECIRNYAALTSST